MRRPAAASNAWFAVQRLALGGTRLGCPLLRLGPGRGLMVGRGTDVCIEGFPRSANTFAYHAFRQANPEAAIAHHLHAPMQVVRAAALGVPCAVLIRPPLEAISSLVIFRDGRLHPALATRAYLDFYGHVEEVRDSVALCGFAEVLADPAVVARRLNAAFGTSFAADPLDERERAELAATIERYDRHRKPDVRRYTVPRPEKEALKPDARRLVAADPRLGRAEELHHRLINARN